MTAPRLDEDELSLPYDGGDMLVRKESDSLSDDDAPYDSTAPVSPDHPVDVAIDQLLGDLQQEEEAARARHALSDLPPPPTQAAPLPATVQSSTTVEPLPAVLQPPTNVEPLPAVIESELEKDISTRPAPVDLGSSAPAADEVVIARPVPSTPPRLYYFPIDGRQLAIEYCFKLGNVPYEKSVIPFEHWPLFKSKMPFGMLPVLELNGCLIPESSVALVYAGARAGLVPTDPIRFAVCRSLHDECDAIITAAVNAFKAKTNPPVENHPPAPQTRPADIVSDPAYSSIHPTGVNEDPAYASTRPVDISVRPVDFENGDIQPRPAPRGFAQEGGSSLDMVGGPSMQAEYGENNSTSQHAIQIRPESGNVPDVEVYPEPLPGRIDDMNTSAAPLPAMVSDAEPLPGVIPDGQTSVTPLPAMVSDGPTSAEPLPAMIPDGQTSAAPLPAMVDETPAERPRPQVKPRDLYISECKKRLDNLEMRLGLLNPDEEKPRTIFKEGRTFADCSVAAAYQLVLKDPQSMLFLGNDEIRIKPYRRIRKINARVTKDPSVAQSTLGRNPEVLGPADASRDFGVARAQAYDNQEEVAREAKPVEGSDVDEKVNASEIEFDDGEPSVLYAYGLRGAVVAAAAKLLLKNRPATSYANVETVVVCEPCELSSVVAGTGLPITEPFYCKLNGRMYGGLAPLAHFIEAERRQVGEYQSFAAEGATVSAEMLTIIEDFGCAAKRMETPDSLTLLEARSADELERKVLHLEQKLEEFRVTIDQLPVPALVYVISKIVKQMDRWGNRIAESVPRILTLADAAGSMLIGAPEISEAFLKFGTTGASFLVGEAPVATHEESQNIEQAP